MKTETVTLYKLTDDKGQAHNQTQWGTDITHEATRSANQNLCSDGWIHAYESPLLAVLLNPIHADFKSPQLWTATGVVGKRDHGLKVGCRKLTTVRRIELPEITIVQKIAFGILCGKEVCRDTEWNKWADNWLSGKDRSKEAAAEMAWAEAEGTAAEVAAEAAWAAAEVAWAAWAAAKVAAKVAEAEKSPIDLIAIAEKAMTIQ